MCPMPDGDEIISIGIFPKEVNIEIGESYQMTRSVAPRNLASLARWFVEDPSVASISDSGIVTGIKVGTTTVWSMSPDHTVSSSKSVIRVSASTQNTLVSSVILNTEEIALGLTKLNTCHLTAGILPKDATNKLIIWSSANTNVATVDQNGIVTAKSVGSTYVYATAADKGGAYDRCHIIVRESAVTGVSISPTCLEIESGKTYQMSGGTNPSGGSIRWFTNDSNIISINATSGVITAKNPGSTYVYAMTTDYAYRSQNAYITVYPKRVSSIRIMSTQVELAIDATKQLQATIMPSDANNKKINWYSCDPSIADVDSNGVVTARREGTTNVYAISADGGYVTSNMCVIRVVRSPLVSRIEISECCISGVVGRSKKLEVSVYPNYATNKKVNWSSTNTSVARVDAYGTVEFVAVGNAIIKATADDGSGATDYCTVEVLPYVRVTGVSIYGAPENRITTYYPWKLTTYQFGAGIKPSNATDKRVNWYSSDPSVASIDRNGLVTINGVGQTVICVETYGGDCSHSITLTVKKPVATITYEKDYHDYFNVKFDSGEYWKGVCYNLEATGDATLVRGFRNPYPGMTMDRANDNLRSGYNFSLDQLAYLYTIDPFGVQYYVKYYGVMVSNLPPDDENYLKMKDDLFEKIFGKKPRYFIKVNGQVAFFEKSSYGDMSRRDMYSDAEVIFGMHSIYNDITIKAFFLEAGRILIDGIVPNVIDELFDTSVSDIIDVYNAIFFTDKFFVSKLDSQILWEALGKAINGSSSLGYYGWIINAMYTAKELGEAAIESFSPSLDELAIYETVNSESFNTVFNIGGNAQAIADIISRARL